MHLPSGDGEPKSFGEAQRLIKKLRMDNQALKEENLEQKKEIKIKENLLQALQEKMPTVKTHQLIPRRKTKKFCELSKFLTLLLFLAPTGVQGVIIYVCPFSEKLF